VGVKGRTSELARLLRCFAVASRRLTVLVIVAGVVSGASLPAFAVAMGWLVETVDDGDPIMWPVLAVVGAFLTGRIVDPLLEEAGQSLWRQVDESLSQRLMTALLDSPGLEPLESATVRDRVVQAQGMLTDLTPGQAAHHLGRVVALVVMGAGSLAIVALFRWWLVVPLVVAYFVAYRTYRSHWHHVTLVLHGRTDRLRHAYYLRGVALEPSAAKETRVFGLADWLVGGYRQRWQAEMVDIWNARREGWGLSAAVITGLAVVEAVVIGFVVSTALDGGLSLGQTVVVVQGVLGAAVLGTYNEGHWLLSECSRAIVRLDEVEDEVASCSVTRGGRSDVAELPRDVIRFEGVAFTYPGADRPVFECLDLEIRAGESLAIVGQNGAGKTTLVKLLCRLYDVDRGAITVDGVDLRDLDPTAWRHRLAAVFQDFVQFELTAYDNIAYGGLHARDDATAVRDAAVLAGAAPVLERLTNGWETPLSRAFSDGTQLSGGEWQRLALARALFAVRTGAGVLILDEPTAALDVRGEAEVYERFLDLTRGATTLVISHRFSTVRRADRIVVIEGGRVVEDGDHNQLLAASGRYAEMYWLQANRFDGGAPDA
jgi:ATP-binding cassette, subfamily B, bacterial